MKRDTYVLANFAVYDKERARRIKDTPFARIGGTIDAAAPGIQRK